MVVQALGETRFREHQRMHLALYIIWFAVPVAFFGLALWSKLEQMSSGGSRGRDGGDLGRQGIFVLVAALLALAIDRYLVLPHAATVLPSWLPTGVVQIALFPLVLLVQARLIGPSQDIVLGRRVRPGERSRRIGDEA